MFQVCKLPFDCQAIFPHHTQTFLYAANILEQQVFNRPPQAGALVAAELRPVVRTAHTILANLLAKATTTTF